MKTGSIFIYRKKVYICFKYIEDPTKECAVENCCLCNKMEGRNTRYFNCQQSHFIYKHNTPNLDFGCMSKILIDSGDVKVICE